VVLEEFPMGRLILAVLLGYLVMAVCVMLAFSVAFVAPDFAFEKDSYEVTPAWIGYALLLSFVAAAVGGFVAVWLAGRPDARAAVALAGVVFLLAVGSAVVQLGRDRPEAKPAEIAREGMMERASKAVQPTWYAFTLPFLGAAGALLGGWLKGRSGGAVSRTSSAVS
jgi:hypothetical protein